VPRASSAPALRSAGGVVYEAERRRGKNINLRVRADGTVALSLPMRAPWAEADAFVASHADWIAKAQSRMAQREARQNLAPLPEKAAALEHFEALSEQVYPAFERVLGGRRPTIKVRDMTSRWGVCAPAKRQITFALRLYNMPAAAQIYVVVHEYCHFLVPNHSPAFWAEVAKLLPDWKQRRKMLK